MLELAGQPLLDKASLVGECVRLPCAVDADRLAAEIAALPDELWNTPCGRIGVHRATQAVFLRGYAPADGALPIEDRPPLDALPYVRHLIRQVIDAPPQRCLLARLPPGASIVPHVDRAPYFAQTLRLHTAVQTHDRVYMLCGAHTYTMRPGETWALNNGIIHGAWNADELVPRIHLICDFLPSPRLLECLARGERNLGSLRPHVQAHFLPAIGTRSAKDS